MSIHSYSSAVSGVNAGILQRLAKNVPFRNVVTIDVTDNEAASMMQPTPKSPGSPVCSSTSQEQIVAAVNINEEQFHARSEQLFAEWDIPQCVASLCNAIAAEPSCCQDHLLMITQHLLSTMQSESISNAQLIQILASFFAFGQPPLAIQQHGDGGVSEDTAVTPDVHRQRIQSLLAASSSRAFLQTLRKLGINDKRPVHNLYRVRLIALACPASLNAIARLYTNIAELLHVADDPHTSLELWSLLLNHWRAQHPSFADDFWKSRDWSALSNAVSTLWNGLLQTTSDGFARRKKSPGADPDAAAISCANAQAVAGFVACIIWCKCS